VIIFSLVFGRLAHMPSDGLPYPLRTFCAMLPWQLFANALTNASNSLVAEQRLISKVYFPRLVVPIAAVLGGLVDFLIAFGVLLIMMAWYRVIPTAAIFTLPLFVLLAVTASLAIAFWLSALNVEFRDVRYVLPFLTQIWFFATPVAYPASIVPEQWRWVYGLNPMVGVVEGFRWALLGKGEPPGYMMLVSALATIVLLVGGLFYFRRMEKEFADIV
jgi:lipopolysaccharide transport system permease protein